MHIHRIILNNFKSFVGEHSIDFDKLQGVWHLSGPIGSGKTSIGEGVLFGLYGSVRGKTQKSLISRGEKRCSVELWCTSKNKQLHIVREINAYGQSPLFVEADGHEIIFTNKIDAQAQLEKEYLDVSQTSAEQLCIISFNNFKSLSSLNTKDAKLFLDQVLGLDELSAYVDECKVQQNVLKKTQIESASKASVIEKQISRIIESDKPLIADPQALTAQISELQTQLKTTENSQATDLAPYNASLISCRETLSVIKSKGSSIARDIKFIKQGTCPQCGAPIDQSHLIEKENERKALLGQYDAESQKATELTQKISEINTEYNEKISSLRRTLQQAQYKHGIVQEQVRQKQQVSGNLSDLQNELHAENNTLLDAEQDAADFKRLSDILNDTIKPAIIRSFIPSINSKISELSLILGLEYIPEYDEEFKCSIRTGGECVPTSSLSTGQLKIADTIIILSIISSVVTKIQCNVMFFDELFSNLDALSAEKLIEAVRASLSQSNSIIIVSHQALPDNLCDGYIRLHLDDGQTIVDIN